MPDKNGLLTEAEIGAILAETGFPDEEVSYKHKVGVVSTINVYPLLQAAVSAYRDHLAGMSDEDMLLTREEAEQAAEQGWHDAGFNDSWMRAYRSWRYSHDTEGIVKAAVAKAIPILRAKWEKEK